VVVQHKGSKKPEWALSCWDSRQLHEEELHQIFLLTKYSGDQTKKNKVRDYFEYWAWWVNRSERDSLKDLDADDSTILKFIYVKKWYGKAWTGLLWLTMAELSASCEHSYELSASFNAGNLLTEEAVVSR
jgi:hypothetical protein